MVLQVILSLVIVIFLILIVATLLKKIIKKQSITVQNENDNIQIIEQKNIDYKNRIVLVKVKNKEFIVSINNNNTNIISLDD